MRGSQGMQVPAGQGGGEGLCVAVCMRCLMECGADCKIGEQAGQAIGKALESNSTLQSLDLSSELGVGVGRAGACMIRGMEGGRAHAWSRQGHVCAHARTGGRMVYMWVFVDVHCAMDYGRGQGNQCRQWGRSAQGMQVSAGQGGGRGCGWLCACHA